MPMDFSQPGDPFSFKYYATAEGKWMLENETKAEVCDAGFGAGRAV